MTRVSDQYIELIPPNPLELQVTVAGAYERLTWSRGGVELAVSGSVSFSDFRQTLTISTTSSGDAGEYTAEVDSESVTFQVQEFSESMSDTHTYNMTTPLVVLTHCYFHCLLSSLRCLPNHCLCSDLCHSR